jgi:hypothetical protein
MTTLTQFPINYRQLLRHIALPLIAPLLIVWLYFTPVTLFGCVNRGLIALGVTSVAFIFSILTFKRAFELRREGDIDNSNRWFLTTVILLIPLALLAGPLG